VTIDERLVAAREAHAQVLSYARRSIESARTAGEHLDAIKRSLDHGDWGPWLKAHCPEISPRTDRVYRRIAREWSKVWHAASIDAALKALSEIDAKTAEPADFALAVERIPTPAEVPQFTPTGASFFANLASQIRALPPEIVAESRKALIAVRSEIDAILSRAGGQ
jgi:hypothetical protein